ncbi:hypothetical protein JRG78_01250 [Microbacterium sp. EF45047]|nr:MULTISPECIES: hypothetical protein [Microbacterium]UWF78576.1 hypothetical protein JSY13_01235 [Microbacterium neungamense]WCM56750.1 hypothetical protein JRG78_01250 [Microbacterium sp. EF45047]
MNSGTGLEGGSATTTKRVPPLRLEFAGEWFDVPSGHPFIIGREGDLEIDDNPYLHRHFLELQHRDGLWWLANIGVRLAATISSAGGAVQSWLSPGARMPLVFERNVIVFTAGPITYELSLHTEEAPYEVSHQVEASMSGETTVMPVSFTPMQKQLMVALAEPMLRREGVSMNELPSSSEAAKRLGWTMSKFNRKLDNVCDKLDRMGVQGLRGGPGKLATNRRARLVEYAVTSQVITRADLPLLDDEALRSQSDADGD